MQGPVVSRVEIAGLPMMSYAVSSPSMDDADLSWFVDNVVSRSLLQSRGVSQVRRQGGVTREIRVELDPDRSEEHTSELQSLMRISYAVFCLKKKIRKNAFRQNIEYMT